MAKGFRMHFPPPNRKTLMKAVQCELCQRPATGEAQNHFGNTILVCDDHAEALSANSAERVADRFFEENYRND